MMYLYTSGDKLPKDVDYYYDVEAEFIINTTGENDIFNNEISNKIMKDIDGITSRDGNAVTNKFGTTAISNISTGCKGALLAINCPNCAVSNIEMGDNVIQELFNLSKTIDIRLVIDNDIITYIPSGTQAILDGKPIDDIGDYLEDYYAELYSEDDTGN